MRNRAIPGVDLHIVIDRLLSRRQLLGEAAVIAASAVIARAGPQRVALPLQPAPSPNLRLPWRGIDASFLPQLEWLGIGFYSGQEQVDVVRLAAAAGINLMRLRVWVNPADGFCDTSHTLAMASRAHAAGMKLLIDLHLSDSWADPGQQTKPAAWAGLSSGALAQRVSDYASGVMAALVAQGTPPAFVQVGNEVTDGLLWPTGRISISGWGAFASLIKAGILGVQSAFPAIGQPQILLHIDRGGDNGAARWFYDNALNSGIPFELIGLSYYPWWHGPLDTMAANLNDLATRYQRPVWLVETSYPWTLAWNDNQNNFVGANSQLLPGFPASSAGQSAYLQRLVELLARVPGGQGQGLCYWAPENIAVPGIFASACENLALFDFLRRVLPGLATLGRGSAPAPQ